MSLGREGGIRGEVERNEGGKNKYNQMQNGPSINKLICSKKNNMLVGQTGPLPHNKQ